MVIEETKKRVAASQKPDYQPHGPHRSMAPWSEDQHKIFDQRNFVPAPRDYFDEEWFEEDAYDEDLDYYDQGDNDFEDRTRAEWQGPPS